MDPWCAWLLLFLPAKHSKPPRTASSLLSPKSFLCCKTTSLVEEDLPLLHLGFFCNLGNYCPEVGYSMMGKDMCRSALRFPLENRNMYSSAAVRLLLFCCLLTAFTGCSRDPNVRKQKYFDSGEKYFAEAKYREAAIQYANALQFDTRFAQAHFQLGQAYLKLGDSQRAFSELSRTVELAPDNYKAHTDLANLLDAVRNPDGSANIDYLKQAKTHLDVLKEKLPNSPETHEAWANYYSAQNNGTAAMQEMQQAIALDPNRSESYLLLALLQVGANLPDPAEVNFKKAIAADPKALNAE